MNQGYRDVGANRLFHDLCTWIFFSFVSGVSASYYRSIIRSLAGAAIVDQNQLSTLKHVTAAVCSNNNNNNSSLHKHIKTNSE